MIMSCIFCLDSSCRLLVESMLVLFASSEKSVGTALSRGWGLWTARKTYLRTSCQKSSALLVSANKKEVFWLLNAPWFIIHIRRFWEEYRDGRSSGWVPSVLSCWYAITEWVIIPYLQSVFLFWKADTAVLPQYRCSCNSFMYVTGFQVRRPHPYCSHSPLDYWFSILT